MSKEFSIFNRPISNTVPLKATTLKEVHELLIGDKYKFDTQRIRVASDKKKRNELKSNNLDYVTFSGTFTRRESDALVNHSGLMVLDFYNLEKVDEVRYKLIHDPNLETALVFRSPSAKGLKWVVYINLEKATHLEWFEGISNYIKKTYGLEVDASGKDVSRACYLCHDPQAYLNPKFKK